MDAETFAELAALRRMVMWLVSKEMARSADPERSLAALSDDLHSIGDEASPHLTPIHPFMRQLEMIQSVTDRLVLEAKHEMSRQGILSSKT